MLFIDTCPAERHCIYHQTIAALGDTTLQAILRPDLIDQQCSPWQPHFSFLVALSSRATAICFFRATRNQFDAGAAGLRSAATSRGRH